MRPTGRIVLRNRPLAYVNLLFAVGFLSLFGAKLLPSSHPSLRDYVFSVIVGTLTVGGFGRAARCRIEIDAPGVTVVKLFTTRRIAWGDLVHASAGPRGIRLLLVDGEVVEAMSYAKSNPRWWDRLAGADKHAALLEAEIRRRHLVVTVPDAWLLGSTPQERVAHSKQLRLIGYWNVATGVAGASVAPLFMILIFGTKQWPAAIVLVVCGSLVTRLGRRAIRTSRKLDE